MMVKVPTGTAAGEDDMAFTELLAEQHQVLVAPGSVMTKPGWVRLCLTASDAMVEYGCGVFETLMAGLKAQGK